MFKHPVWTVVVPEFLVWWGAISVRMGCYWLVRGSISFPNRAVQKIKTLFLLNNKANTVFGSAVFAIFAKHCTSKCSVNTACSNTVFDLQTVKRSHFDESSLAVFVPWCTQSAAAIERHNKRAHISIANQFNRYLRTAEQYIYNVGRGEFPKAQRR